MDRDVESEATDVRRVHVPPASDARWWLGLVPLPLFLNNGYKQIGVVRRIDHLSEPTLHAKEHEYSLEHGRSYRNHQSLTFPRSGCSVEGRSLAQKYGRRGASASGSGHIGSLCE
jgi:hypothetical protein